jgi:hypothetical protein
MPFGTWRKQLEAVATEKKVAQVTDVYLQAQAPGYTLSPKSAPLTTASVSTAQTGAAVSPIVPVLQVAPTVMGAKLPSTPAEAAWWKLRDLASHPATIIAAGVLAAGVLYLAFKE